MITALCLRDGRFDFGPKSYDSVSNNFSQFCEEIYGTVSKTGKNNIYNICSF